MPKSAKAMLLATAVIGLTGQAAFGLAFPNVLDFINGFSQFGTSKYGVGNDGNARVIWDIFNPPPTFAYTGSTLWILNPQGQITNTGDTPIPSSVGTGANTFGSSNIAIHVNPSGNTTLAFAFVTIGATAGTPPVVLSFATWTYNAQGKLIASAGPFGPFVGTELLNLEFRKDVLIAKWVIQSGTNFSWSAWTLDEFGNITSGAGPFGSFPNNTLLGQIDVSKVNGQQVQLWNWLIETVSPPQKFGLNVWTIDHTGNVIAANSFGPF